MVYLCFLIALPWFKKCIFWKDSLSPFRDPRGRRGHFRGRLRPKFGFHLFLMSFHLEFSPIWVSRSFDLSDLGDLRRAQWIFSKITFLKSVRSNEKDEVCHNFIVNIFTKSPHRGGVWEKQQKKFLISYWFEGTSEGPVLNDSKLICIWVQVIPLIIHDQFYTIQNLQRSLIPQTMQ